MHHEGAEKLMPASLGKRPQTVYVEGDFPPKSARSRWLNMAEDENSQDQGQPESQPPGGGGFISLDQARSAALAHARDNLDFYGRRYGRKELAWEVLSQEEREDGYHVRLSYQPARGFRGQPGVEEFTIERTGSVQSRLIISEPAKKGGFLGCGLVAVGILLLTVVVLVAALGSAL